MSNHSPTCDKLPPGTNCIVCGDLATGNHYSVPSCNGCKTFFRRAIVNSRKFTCMGNGHCPIDKGVRCACRACRLEKCLQVGMDPNAIQSERDRIGYTKRTRRDKPVSEFDDPEYEMGAGEQCEIYNTNETNMYESDEEDITLCDSKESSTSESVNDMHRSKSHVFETVLERLTQLENNFTLLLSRSAIQPYASLEEALKAPSRFSQPVNVKISDPIVQPDREQKMPFWRSRIIALYIDWAKTFSAFRKLPYSDKIALITNHASSYMIMCEAFRTPELINDDEFISGIEKIAEKLPHDQQTKPATLLHDALSLSPQHGLGQASSSDSTQFPRNLHTFFDPHNQLIHEGSLQSGVHTSAEVPPEVHHPNIGLNGLTPVMVAMIDCVMKPFRKLNISTTEFAALQAIMFFDPDTEGLDAASQRNVCAEQKKMICAFYSHICQHNEPAEAEKRFSAILLRIPMIRKVAAKKNESLQIIDLFNLFTLNSLVKETTLGIKGGSSSQNSI